MKYLCKGCLFCNSCTTYIAYHACACFSYAAALLFLTLALTLALIITSDTCLV